ncbi:MAG: hypothetical protein ASARMPREDX12_006076 [Alectoria sarmentosa]|nr:MAG: hypothetical protein ASARMPREDX12_006076 [Alectoria sarmentosa]
MVTGIETAGLVLAILPLLIEALSVYKKGLEKTGMILGFKQKRYKLKVERLRLRLKGQSASLHLNLAKLIGRAAPNEDFMRLPEDYNDVLWTGNIAERIKAYLQPGGGFEAFQVTLSLYESYLEEIAEKLVGVLRPPKADKKDLKALLEANKPDQGHYRFSQRLAFIMNEASIDELLGELSDSTLSLRDFVDDNEDLHQILISNKEPQQAKLTRAANSLHKVRKHADALFRAIACGWSQQCHERHGAMLCLEHRCQEKYHALQAASAGGKTAVSFTILFSWQNQASQGIVSWHETSILTLDEDSPHVLRHAGSAKTSAKKSVTWSTSPDINIIITSTEIPPPGGSVPIEVTSICKTLAEVKPPVLHLSSDNRLFWDTELPNNILRPARSGKRTMSLEVFLEDRRQMDPEDRIKLATNLASSLLQYNLTPWLRRCWTKTAVHFFVQTRTLSGIDVEHPSIMRHFSDQAGEALNELPENDPELALMELGILLLEIWTMSTFESWLKTAGHPMDCSQLQDRYIRLRYSIEWFQSLKGKLLPNYQKVVGICLRPSVFDLFHTSWEDADFRMAVYREVVEPLLIWND